MPGLALFAQVAGGQSGGGAEEIGVACLSCKEDSPPRPLDEQRRFGDDHAINAAVVEDGVWSQTHGLFDGLMELGRLPSAESAGGAKRPCHAV